jgi:hypothetical protein
MKRWTNGLPGATMRLGAMMAQRGLSASQPRIRADTNVDPEFNAPLQRPDTLMQLPRSSLSEIRLVQRGRAIHHGTFRKYRLRRLTSVFGAIVLKNSKIAGLRKSRKCSALAIFAAARCCNIGTRASDRFCGNSCGPSHLSDRDAPAVLRIFSHQQKRTFSTQSERKRTS